MATGGEEGTMPEWVRVDTADHRRMETAQAAAVLGVSEVHHLGLRDSGMAGSDTNRHPDSLTSSVSRAADALAEIVDRYHADALVGQDSNGIYGHPDHVAVHQITRQAAARLGTPEVLEATMDRQWLSELRADRVNRGRLDPGSWQAASLERVGVKPTADGWISESRGAPQTLLRIDLAHEWDAKQAAMAAHASQVPDAADFMGIPPGVFHRVLAHEWFLRVGSTAGSVPTAGPLEQSLGAVVVPSG